MKGRRKKATGPVTAGTIATEPPSWLDDYAVETWRKTLADIATADRSLDELDRETLLAFCVAASTIRRASEEIRRDGLTVTGRDGPKRHPALAAQNTALTQIRLLAAELGLTPASRGRLPAPPTPPEENPFDALR